MPAEALADGEALLDDELLAGGAPRAGGRRGDLDIREGALSHGRGVNDTLQFLVEANRVGVHVLVGAAGDLDLIIDCAQFEDQ